MLKKVSAIDDSELIHNMYRLILRKYKGCQLLNAMNGREGLEKDVAKGLSLGAKGYIVKPFRSNVLHDLIDNILSKEEATG